MRSRASSIAGQGGQAVRAPRAPGRPALLGWLTSDEVVTTAGQVLSWASPTTPGYPYPELGGLWLTGMCRSGRELRAPTTQVDAVARWLCDRVEADGAAARRGVRYLFDSAMVLGGLLDYAAVRGATARLRRTIDRLLAFMGEAIRTRHPVAPLAPEPATRWSLAFGPHLLKVAIALHKAATHGGRPEAGALVAPLVAPLLPLFDGHRFVVHAGSGLSYSHASAYALEGLAYLDAVGPGEHAAMLDAGAASLAANQLPDGGLPPFFEGGACHGASRSDAVAQAVRLWCLRDPARWREPIARALAHLAAAQVATGGIRYRAGLDHVNTWASLFALQATEWADAGGGTARELI